MNVDIVHHKGAVEVHLGQLLSSKALAAPVGDSFNEGCGNSKNVGGCCDSSPATDDEPLTPDSLFFLEGDGKLF